MIIFLSLLAIIFICVFLVKKDYNATLSISSIILAICAFVYIFMHLIMWLTCSYSFDKALLERKELVDILELSRKNKNNLESATIYKSILEFNNTLAVAKYDNTFFFLDDYIDDRIKYVEPIK